VGLRTDLDGFYAGHRRYGGDLAAGVDGDIGLDGVRSAGPVSCVASTSPEVCLTIFTCTT